MMKRFIKDFFKLFSLILILELALYLAIAFLLWKWNPYEWAWFLKLIFRLATIGIVLIVSTPGIIKIEE
jgi:hypothetical protein